MSSQWQLVADGDWLKGQTFPLKGHTVLGRESSCDITIPGTHLSRRHAELAINGDKLQVRDLGSANGTFVNGQRIDQAELYPGDTIRFDVLSFSIEGPGQTRSAKTTTSQQNGATAEADNAKRWKTKPTSVGNRHDTVHMPIAKKAANKAALAATVILAIASVAAVAYLITLL